jgi:hypothetical protein
MEAAELSKVMDGYTRAMECGLGRPDWCGFAEREAKGFRVIVVRRQS